MAKRGKSASFLRSLRRKYHLGEFSHKSRATVSLPRSHNVIKMARKHNRSKRHVRRFSLGRGHMFGVDLVDISVKGVAAGLNQLAGAKVSTLSHNAIAGATAQVVAAAGTILAGKYLHIDLLKKFGEGLAIGTIADYVAATPTVLGMGSTASTSTYASSSPSNMGGATF